jgi:MSHA biogenesis protein MshJ
MNEYWLTLQKQYQRLETLINNILLRERILLLITLLIVINILWLLLVKFPQDEKIAVAQGQEVSLIQQLNQLQKKIADIEKNAKEHPYNSSGSIKDTVLVSSATIVPVIKSLAVHQPDMTLKDLLNLPDKAFDVFLDKTNNQIPTTLYEQGITLVFIGSYPIAYEYLHSIENSKWLLFWDELQYKVTKYPEAEIRLTLHTINNVQED